MPQSQKTIPASEIYITSLPLLDEEFDTGEVRLEAVSEETLPDEIMWDDLTDSGIAYF